MDLLHSDYYALLSVEFGLCKIRNLRISLDCDHSFANGFKLKGGHETSALGQTFICIIAFCPFFKVLNLMSYVDCSLFSVLLWIKEKHCS